MARVRSRVQLPAHIRPDAHDVLVGVKEKVCVKPVVNRPGAIKVAQKGKRHTYGSRVRHPMNGVIDRAIAAHQGRAVGYRGRHFFKHNNGVRHEKHGIIGIDDEYGCCNVSNSNFTARATAQDGEEKGAH